MAEDMYPKPSVSRNVHYVDDGHCLAAIVTEIPSKEEDTVVTLVVFPPRAHSAILEHVGQGSPGDSKEDGTWHWPERV